jgi:hypothetical protein
VIWAASGRFLLLTEPADKISQEEEGQRREREVKVRVFHSHFPATGEGGLDFHERRRKL